MRWVKKIGEFGELTAICQYFTYQYLLTNLVPLLLNPKSPNISPPILGDKPIHQYFPLPHNFTIRYIVVCLWYFVFWFKALYMYIPY